MQLNLFASYFTCVDSQNIFILASKYFSSSSSTGERENVAKKTCETISLIQILARIQSKLTRMIFTSKCFEMSDLITLTRMYMFFELFLVDDETCHLDVVSTFINLRELGNYHSSGKCGNRVVLEMKSKFFLWKH